MSRYLTTSDDAFGPGIIIARMKDYDEPEIGEPWRLDERPSLKFGYIKGVAGPKDGATYSAYAEDGPDTVSDAVGFVRWKAYDGQGGRDLSPTSFIFASRVVPYDEDREVWQGAEDKAGTAAYRVRAVFRPDPDSGIWLPDDRLADLGFDRPLIQYRERNQTVDGTGVAPTGGGDNQGEFDYEWPIPIIGEQTITLAGTDERRQYDLVIPADPRLAVPFRAGEEDHSRYLVDVRERIERGAGTGEFEVDLDRRARLADIIVVGHGGQTDGGQKTKGWQGALLLKEGIGQRGWGLCVARPNDGPTDQGGGSPTVNAFLSYEKGGPLHPGSKDDKHHTGSDPDNKRIGPMHEWTGAIIYRDPEHDGPHEYSQQIWDPNGRATYSRKTRPLTQFDPTSRSIDRRPDGSDQGQGQWKIDDTVPFLPPNPPTIIPPRRPRDPIPEIIEDDDGGSVTTGDGGNGDGGDGGSGAPGADGQDGEDGKNGLGVGEPTDPQAGSGTDGLRFDYEATFKSIAGEAVRERDEMPGDGRYGEGTIVAPYDPFDPRNRGGGAAPNPTLPGSDTDGEGAVALPDPDDDDGFFDPFVDGGAAPNPTLPTDDEAARRRREEAERIWDDWIDETNRKAEENARRRRERERQERDARLDPFRGLSSDRVIPPSVESPKAFDIVGRAATDGAGGWNLQEQGRSQNPAATSRTGIPYASAMQVLPPGVFPDGTDDQSHRALTQLMTLLLYDGMNHGPSGSLAAAVEFVMGRWDKASGKGVGGPVLKPVGTSGEADLEFDGRDTSGASRVAATFRPQQTGQNLGDVDHKWDIEAQDTVTETLEVSSSADFTGATVTGLSGVGGPDQVARSIVTGSIAIGSTAASVLMRVSLGFSSTIDNITGGVGGQRLVIHCRDNFTISDSATGTGQIFTQSGSNIPASTGDFYDFIYDSTDAAWYQL